MGGRNFTNTMSDFMQYRASESTRPRADESERWTSYTPNTQKNYKTAKYRPQTEVSQVKQSQVGSVLVGIVAFDEKENREGM